MTREQDRELAALFTPSVPIRPVALAVCERRNLADWNARAREVGALPPAPPAGRPA
jgi:hypothetical protein